MELTSKVDGVNNEDKIKKNKTIMFFIIAMLVVLAILAVFICIYIGQLKTNLFKLTIDDVQSKSFVENKDVIIDKSSGDVYFSVAKLCEQFGYTLNIDASYFLNEKSENSFFIEGPNETVNFFYFDEYKEEYKSFSNKTIEGLKEEANKFQKVIRKNGVPGEEGKPNSYTERTSEDDKEQSFTLNHLIVKYDDSYYISMEDARVAFNIMIDYTKDNNSISIYTLDYLVNAYSSEIENSALLDENILFCNKKALLYGYIITKAEVDEEIKYGVTSLETKKTVIPNTRASVEFVEGNKEFIVTTTKLTSQEYQKVAIYSIDGKEIIPPDYVEITKIDDKRGWYLVMNISADKVSRYGIVDKNNKKVIDVKYKKIGIDKNKFAFQSIDSPYILFDSVIPAQRFTSGEEEDWVFLNEHNQVLSPDNISKVGCTSSETSNSGGALLFEEKGYKYIIIGRKYDQSTEEGEVKQIEAYTLMNLDGEILEGNPVESFYVGYNDRGVYFEPLTDEQESKETKMAIVLINDKLLVDRNNKKSETDNDSEDKNNNDEIDNKRKEDNRNEQVEEYIETDEKPGDNRDNSDDNTEESSDNTEETSEIEVKVEQE